MNYWWVNQNQTYKAEVKGGFLWSPKTKRNGARNQFYDNMALVAAGDVVLSFCDTRIRAIGTVLEPAQTAEKPNFGSVGSNWANEGWFVPVEYTEIENPPRPKDFISELRPFLASTHAPLRTNGDGLQSVYLASVSADFAHVILGKIGSSPELISELMLEGEAAAEEEAVRGRTDIGATTKQQLINSRRGQGVFKANVRLNESGCRFTGVSDPRLLIASHIKPWSKCNDVEKLDGCNGLLLSPHVDRLFDRGLISFGDSGDVLTSKQMPHEIMNSWGLGSTANVGPFKPEQCVYLDYHRRHIFRR
jgi:putative restriction endonuclease